MNIEKIKNALIVILILLLSPIFCITVKATEVTGGEGNGSGASGIPCSGDTCWESIIKLRATLVDENGNIVSPNNARGNKEALLFAFPYGDPTRDSTYFETNGSLTNYYVVNTQRSDGTNPIANALMSIDHGYLQLYSDTFLDYIANFIKSSDKTLECRNNGCVNPATGLGLTAGNYSFLDLFLYEIGYRTESDINGIKNAIYENPNKYFIKIEQMYTYHISGKSYTDNASGTWHSLYKLNGKYSSFNYDFLYNVGCNIHYEYSDATSYYRQPTPISNLCGTPFSNAALTQWTGYKTTWGAADKSNFVNLKKKIGNANLEDYGVGYIVFNLGEIISEPIINEVFCTFEINTCNVNNNEFEISTTLVSNQDKNECIDINSDELNSYLSYNVDDVKCVDEVTYNFSNILNEFNNGIYNGFQKLSIPSVTATVTRTCIGNRQFLTNKSSMIENNKLTGFLETLNLNLFGTDYTFTQKVESETADKLQINGLTKAKRIYEIRLSYNLADNSLLLPYNIANRNFINSISIDKNNSSYGISSDLINSLLTSSISVTNTKTTAGITATTNITYSAEGSNNLSCDFETTIENNPVYETTKFRVIDLSNPFPAKDGTSRLPGINWLNEKNNVYKYITDNRNVQNSTNTIDPEEVYRKDPLYTITLNPSTMKKIRAYNKEHDYTDIILECIAGDRACLSQFLKDEDIFPNEEVLDGTCANITEIDWEEEQKNLELAIDAQNCYLNETLLGNDLGEICDNPELDTDNDGRIDALDQQEFLNRIKIPPGTEAYEYYETGKKLLEDYVKSDLLEQGVVVYNEELDADFDGVVDINDAIEFMKKAVSSHYYECADKDIESGG